MSSPYQDMIEILKECVSLGPIERILSDDILPDELKREQLIRLGCIVVGKRCTGCKVMKPIRRFATHNKAKDGKYGLCDTCLYESMKVCGMKGRTINDRSGDF